MIKIAYWSLTSYKYDLLVDAYSNKEIVGLIDSQNSNVDKNDDSSLIYNNIFPYHQISFTENKADAYLLFDVNKNNVNRHNTNYHDLYIVIWCMSHRERMRVKNKNGARTDLLAEAVERMFIENEKKQSLKYGFNKLELIKSNGIILDTNYLYRELVFLTNDLKHPVGI